MAEPTSPAKLPTEPVSLELPRSGKTALIKPYTTGRMNIATRAVFLKHLNVNPAQPADGEEPTEQEARDAVQFDKIPGDAIDEINRITVEHMVISIDGNTDKVLDQCLDLPADDYDAIVEKCNDIDKETTLSKQKKTK